jgi:hypothetical protein
MLNQSPDTRDVQERAGAILLRHSRNRLYPEVYPQEERQLRLHDMRGLQSRQATFAKVVRLCTTHVVEGVNG